MVLLKEYDVVKAVAVELENKGYHIDEMRKTTQKGDDIEASKMTGKKAVKLYVEAKGETSSRTGSKRYGEIFDSAQSKIHVAEAFYRAVEVISRSPKKAERIISGIALPDNDLHKRYAKEIEPIIKKLGIVLFWVDQSKNVVVSINSDLL